MPLVSSKRQITLPIDKCKLAGIEPGDEYDCYVDNAGNLTIVKKILGAANSLLKDVTIDKSISDDDSLQSSITA